MYDALAFLSDDSDEEVGAGDAELADADQPDSKRQKKVALDFDALQRAGFQAAGTSQDAEHIAAKEAFHNSCAALENDLRPNLAEVDDPAPPSPKGEELMPSCELPPEGVQVWDETGAEELSPCATFEEAEAGGMPQEILAPLRRAGFTKPMPIQAATWPIILSGRDVAGVAKTEKSHFTNSTNNTK